MSFLKFVTAVAIPTFLANFILLFLYCYYISPPLSWGIVTLGTVLFSVVSCFLSWKGIKGREAQN